MRKVSPGGHKTPLEWMAQRSLSDQTIIGLMYTLWDSPTHCKRSCTPTFFFYGPTTLHVPKLFHQSTTWIIHPLLSPLPLHPSVTSLTSPPCLSIPPTFHISPCTHEPLGTQCSCRCLPMKPHGRKSISYHHLDCGCLQWDEQI